MRRHSLLILPFAIGLLGAACSNNSNNVNVGVNSNDVHNAANSAINSVRNVSVPIPSAVVSAVRALNATPTPAP